MLHEKQAKIFGEDIWITFESSFGSRELEDLVVLDAQGANGEDLMQKHGAELVTQILFQLFEKEAEEIDEP
jgi:hypothetical protein